MQKNPLSGSSVNSQVSLLFSKIIGSKYKNGLPCDLFLQRLNLILKGYIILDRTHSSHGISGNSPKNMRKLSVYKKAGILRCELMIHFRKNMIAQPSFYY